MVLLFWAMNITAVFAQANQVPRKVGVVLSGGGAKGMAHIGVLKVIEKAGIPVEVITGTSMGSIIGGLYASGYRSQQLDSIVRAQDWGFVLSDKEEMMHQSLQEREKQNTYAFTRSIAYSGKRIEGSGGFIMGKNINSLFSRLTAPYNDSIDFNRLPIPFACVATNIIDNTEYVFHQGVLPLAMRASMAIPGVFSPVRVNDMVLVDGGLRNNFPADIASEMGADFIIGVTVQGKPKTAEELSSATSILGQIVDVNCKNKYEENLAITDIPIRVNTAGYGSASFNANAIDTLIRRGEEAAMEHWDELRELGKLFDESRRNQPMKDGVVVGKQNLNQPIADIRFVNISEADEQYVRSKFKIKEGAVFDPEETEQITTVMRTDLFYQSADCRIINNAVEGPDGEKAARAVFVAGEKKTNQVSLGVRFDNEEIVALQANAAFPLRTKLPMELDFTLRLGKRIMGKVDWDFHPKSFINHSVSASFWHKDIDLYEYGKKSFNTTFNQYNVTVMPLNFNLRNFNFRIGAAWDYYDFKNLLVDRLPEHQIDHLDNQHIINYQANVDYNSENHWFFPTKGARFKAKFAYHTDNFVNFKDEGGLFEYAASWRKSFTIGRSFTLQPMLYGRIMTGENIPFFISNAIGGEWFGHYAEQQMPFAGMGHVELAWDKFLAAQIQAQMHLTENNIVQLRFAIAQDADEFKDILDHHTKIGTSLSYYYNTMFGPLGATLGYSNVTEKPYFFLNLGFVF